MLTAYSEFKNSETEGAIILGLNLNELKAMLVNNPYQLNLKEIDPQLPNLSIILFAELTDELLIKRIRTEIPQSRSVPIEVTDVD